MGTDDIFKRSKKQKLLERASETKSEIPIILIVCEGEKTEPNYFKGFRLTNVKVETAKGGDAQWVIEKTIEFNENGDYDVVYCVFDRDSSPANRFNTAFEIARTNNFRCIYSNEAFELWYILHFDLMQSAKHRGEYEDMLTERLEQKYKKNDRTLYNKIISKQKVAIKNAKTLLKSYPKHNPEKDNPTTNVFMLVEELNKWVE